MSMISPVQSRDHEGSPMTEEEKSVKVGSICWKGWLWAWMTRVAMMTEMGWEVKEMNRNRTD